MTNFESWWSSSYESQRNWWWQNIFHWYWGCLWHSLSLRWLFVSLILIWEISGHIAGYWCLWVMKKKEIMKRQNSSSSDILINDEIAACTEFSSQWDSVNDLHALAFRNCKCHNYFLSLWTEHNCHSHCCLRWCMRLWDHIWVWKKTNCKKTVF